MSEAEELKRFFDWLRTGSTGCFFARALAVQAEKAKWKATVFACNVDKEIGPLLNALLLDSISVGDDVHQFFFPSVTDPEHAVALIKSICTHPSWLCTEIKLADDDGAFAVALRWKHPNPEYINWVIGFSNMASMPPTRRAPSTSMVIRTGNPSPTAGIAKGMLEGDEADDNEVAKRKKDFGKTPVHVADVPPLLKNNEQIVKFWVASKNATSARLEGYVPQDAAKAKTTFVLPREHRVALADVFARSG